MFNNICKAFYLSLFLAAIRKIVYKAVISPSTRPTYAVVIPFCNHGIIAGKYRTKSIADRAAEEIERESEYKCSVVEIGKLNGYISCNCSGSSSSIFDNDRTLAYLSGVKLGLCRGIVKSYEGTI